MSSDQKVEKQFLLSLLSSPWIIKNKNHKWDEEKISELFWVPVTSAVDKSTSFLQVIQSGRSLRCLKEKYKMVRDREHERGCHL